MGGAYSMHGRNEKCIHNFGWKPEGKIYIEDQGIDGQIILEWFLGK